MKRKALFLGVNEYKDPEIRNLNHSLSDGQVNESARARLEDLQRKTSLFWCKLFN